MTTQHLTASDLMIGDWVQIVPTAPIMSNEYHRIDWIRTGEIGLDNRKTVTYPYIQPIPLTPEILENNGFYLSQRDKYHAFLKRETFEVELKKSTSIEKVLGVKHLGNMYYTRKSYNLPLPTFVHELQHALKLCGIEKEITL